MNPVYGSSLGLMTGQDFYLLFHSAIKVEFISFYFGAKRFTFREFLFTVLEHLVLNCHYTPLITINVRL